MASITENHQRILSEIAEACASVGRQPNDVRLVAVSKTVGLPEVAQAVAAGIHDFGENRSALLNEKQAAFPEQHWHFIGSIQTNKVRDIVGAALIHSVASERALLAIQKRAAERELVQDALVEVNVSGEASKDGLAPAALPGLLELAGGLANVRIRGLMTMAPLGSPDAARTTFAGLRQLRDAWAPRFAGSDHVQLEELSMGMSDDFTIAVQEGATIVRIGRSIWT
ncbi:MAG: YggS family pyridoxal phosphate-dependent enzyme [Coriobacteriales bacterium]|jgi:pyridoxal phosphate enzyme (YggS family)|nr:YggS family pyridoxal phosphate-dependent enzyme [Coriobacteriales bacterium]